MNLGDLMDLIRKAENITYGSHEHGIGDAYSGVEPVRFRQLSDVEQNDLLSDLHDLVRGVCELKKTNL